MAAARTTVGGVRALRAGGVGDEGYSDQGHTRFVVLQYGHAPAGLSSVCRPRAQSHHATQRTRNETPAAVSEITDRTTRRKIANRAVAPSATVERSRNTPGDDEPPGAGCPLAALNH